MMDLHNQIMNIATPKHIEDMPTGARLTYKEGHRDARHAAAELVAQAAPVVAASELSDEQIEALWNEHASTGYLTVGALQFARAVLAAATPAASVAKPIGVVEPMPGTSGFTMACFEASKVPVGTNLYATPSPAVQQPAEGGWIANTGVQPVADGVMVDVEFGNDSRRFNQPAEYWEWSSMDDLPIVRWRPAAPTQAEGQ